MSSWPAAVFDNQKKFRNSDEPPKTVGWTVEIQKKQWLFLIESASE